MVLIKRVSQPGFVAHSTCGWPEMVGPSGSVVQRWTILTKHSKMGTVGLAPMYLGCDHKRQAPIIDGRRSQAIEYGMRHFMRSCLDADREVASLPNDRLPTVATLVLEPACGGDALTAPGREDHWLLHRKSVSWRRLHCADRRALVFPIASGPARGRRRNYFVGSPAP